MSVTLSQVNQLTSNLYGFRTYDWDRNRGGDSNPILVAKVSFERPRSIESGADYEPYDLTNKTAHQIAEIFNEIYLKKQNVEIRDSNYQAKSLHLRVGSGDTIPSHPFIFVMGIKLANNPMPSSSTSVPSSTDTPSVFTRPVSKPENLAPNSEKSFVSRAYAALSNILRPSSSTSVPSSTDAPVDTRPVPKPENLAPDSENSLVSQVYAAISNASSSTSVPSRTDIQENINNNESVYTRTLPNPEDLDPNSEEAFILKLFVELSKIKKD